MKSFRFSSLGKAALLAALASAGVAAHAELLYGLTTTNGLVRFDSATPTFATTPVNITGLVVTNEQILGIDYRPANGQLIGLGSSGRIYSLNAVTGAATFMSVLTGATLTGTSFGVDFNPTVDRLRVTSNAGQNLRINVDTGAVTVDGALNGPVTSIVASAYTNNFAGATSTTLYNISASTDSLYVQNPPNNGTLALVGPLGIDAIGVAGFDISGSTGVAFAALTNGDTGDSSLYTINLITGAATAVGTFGYGGNTAISAPLLGITAVPEPGTYGLLAMGLGVVGFLARRRRAD